MSSNIILLIPNYTEKSFVVAGDTKQIKEDLQAIGSCRFNPHLKDNDGNKLPGWVFGKKPYSDVLSFLQRLEKENKITLQTIEKRHESVHIEKQEASKTKQAASKTNQAASNVIHSAARAPRSVKDLMDGFE